MFKRLLVPLDRSRFGSRAVRYAVEIAKRFGSEVILLHVIQSAVRIPSTTGMAPYVQNPASAEITVQAAIEVDKRNATRAKRYLSSKVRAIKSQDVKAKYQVVVGDPAQSIIEFTEKGKMDLVVMTTHGRSGLKRAVMGSVADAVIRNSGKPVLTVRPHTGSKR
jgi:nucleotide-binding universal stress UspA family protein